MMMRGAFRTLSILLLLAAVLSARDLSEIRSSGVLRVAIREKETVYYQSKKGITGLHYQLVTRLAKNLGVKVEFKTVQIGDYFKKDLYGRPELFKEVDLFADNLTGTAARKNMAAFIGVFDIIEVILHSDRLKLKTLNDLSGKRVAVAKGSSYEDVLNELKKEVHGEIMTVRVQKTSFQLDNVISGNVDFTILDVDQALYEVSKNDGLVINIDILSGMSRIKNLGWFVSHDSKELLEEIVGFIVTVRKEGDFARIWKAVYGSDYRDYLEMLKVADDRGAEILKQGLDYYLQQEYVQALDLLKKSMQTRLYSEKMVNLYDKIFLDYLKQTVESGEEEKGAQIIRTYLHPAPSEYVLGELHTVYQKRFGIFLDGLKKERDQAIEEGEFKKAAAIQEKIIYLSPRSGQAKDELKELNTRIIALEVAKTNILLQEPPPIETVVEDKEKKEPITETQTEKIFAEPVEGDQKVLTALKKKTEKEVEVYEGERFFKTGVVQYGKKNYDDALVSFYNARSLKYRSAECDNYIARIDTIKASILRRENLAKQKEFNKHYSQAIKYYLKNNFSAALNHILRCLDILPDNQNARKYFELISDRLKLEGEKKIDDTSPYYTYYMIKMSLARGYMDRGKYQEAKVIIEELLTLFPHNEEAKQILILCAYKLSPEDMESIMKDYVERGKKFLAAKNLDMARKQFEFVKKMKPDYPGLNSYIKQSTPKPKPKVTNAPFSLENELARGLKLYQGRKLRESLTVYRRIIKYYPENYTAIVNIGRIESELALKVSGSSEKRPDSAARRRAENYYLKGKYFFRLKEYKKAVDFMDKAYKADNTYTKAIADKKRIEKLMAY